MDERYSRYPITKVSRGVVEELEDPVITEYPFTINFNGEEMVTLLCTPEHLEELAVGFLASEGLLRNRSQLQRTHLDVEKGLIDVEAEGQHNVARQLFLKRYITTGCGKGTSFYSGMDSSLIKPVESQLQIKAEDIFALMKQLQDRSELYRTTGGVHSAALATTDEMLIFREDVGRHNAVDKLFGRCFLEQLNLEDKILLTSGRISSEILLKMAKRGIAVLVSRSAPTDLAVRLADQLGITLIGFVRGSRMNIYTHRHKVTE
ncbi:MAG TPA: formate dehydrogenase accessory sulfurtransferase FdhD [Bacillota bacterium]|nr:formate dehydrogenase accessory sulfurtransferase FdhD [Bacillota bacterium]